MISAGYNARIKSYLSSIINVSLSDFKLYTIWFTPVFILNLPVTALFSEIWVNGIFISSSPPFLIKLKESILF